MSDHSTPTTTRREFVLPSPSSWGSVRTMLDTIDEGFPPRQNWKDTVHVEARDGAIVFWYDAPDDTP